MGGCGLFRYCQHGQSSSNALSSQLSLTFPSLQFSADVLACNVNSGDVEVLDTWNLAPDVRANVVDNVQDVYLFSGEVIDGRISCS